MSDVVLHRGTQFLAQETFVLQISLCVYTYKVINIDMDIISSKICHLITPEQECIGEAFQATTRFKDSDIFQTAIQMALRCILSVNSFLS